MGTQVQRVALDAVGNGIQETVVLAVWQTRGRKPERERVEPDVSPDQMRSM